MKVDILKAWFALACVVAIVFPSGQGFMADLGLYLGYSALQVVEIK